MSVAASARRLGRFELRRLLGRGAQASVWLGHDPRLEREVAVKLLDAGAGAFAVNEWLDEGRAVSRLGHPNIVPVFEADQQDGQPYLVFEYVEGPTLAEALRQRGAFAPRDAATLMLGVLDALAAAHEQGIVHRDLKPSNILLGRDGRARVMDFGIAARIGGGSGSQPGAIVGTPGYISPEAARGESPQPAMDVFSAGAMFGELLAGKPMLRESDPYRALERVQHEDLALPAAVAVDDGLRGIVARALARDLHQRYDGAAAMRAALAAWLEPDAAVATPATSHGTLEFLLRRMRNKGDFPALSESVGRIQRIASSETESLSSLAGEILHDVALTNKLLRMVNSAHFNTGGGAVSTISRAVALVGFAGIRNMALSLLLLEHMRDQGHAAFLKDEFLRALMAGMLASELSSTTREGEEAFLGSMFQNLGRLLTEYYFPEEAQQIRRQLGDAKAGAQEREKAAARVLGIGFEELGCAVARSWGLPENLQRSMRAPAGAVPARGAALGIERQRWLGRASNEIGDLLLDGEGEVLERQLGGLAERYAAVLGMAPRAIVEGVGRARTELERLMPAMGLRLGPQAAARRLVAVPPMAADASPRTLVAPRADEAATLVVPRPEAAATLLLPQRSEAAEILANGVQDITNTMVDESFRIDEVLRKVLDTMLRALAFRRVIFCLRDPRTETLTGRFGLGAGAKETSALFKVPLRVAPESDLFTAVCVKAVDTLIADAGARNIAGRVPAWYRAAANAPTFLLLPMLRKGQPFALIYADKAEAGAITLQDREMALLGTLRNQAVMAFRQTELRGA